MKKIYLLFFIYIFTIFCVFLYSYTQVDLSLTLSRVSIYQTIEKYFQHIGYFQRLISTQIFLSLVILLSILSVCLLYYAKKKLLSRKLIWGMIIITAILLTFSYNAFSYDLFNYIFDAKIVTHYHQNPYVHKALDFTGDPMLSFMRWTHRTYPYGPVWLAITVPLSFLGLQYFLPTFYLFKIVMGASFLGSAFFISKIMRKIAPDDELFSLVFFSLNPLVIIESLVSAHNDIVMIFFALAAFYYLFEKKYFRSILFLLLSIGIKFVTVLLVPVFLYVYFNQMKQKSIQWRIIFFITGILLIPTVFVASIRTNFQPWYILFSLPYFVMAEKKLFIILPVFIMSFFSLLEYAPYLFYGDYNPPVPSLLFWILLLGIGLAGVSGVITFFSQFRYKRA